ncbi:5-formyltetrahydrofolate cyclo-ligase [Nesterenkonia flava]
MAVTPAPTNPEEIAAAKARVRRRLRSARARLSSEELAARAVRLQKILASHIEPGAVVAGYVPIRGEPDILPFLKHHAPAGTRADQGTTPDADTEGRVYLPVTPTDGSRHLLWVPWTAGDPMRKHSRLPMFEPEHSTEDGLLLPQLVQATAASPTGHLVLLVPALAVDSSGARMGQGGGFYDTTLADLIPAVRQHPDLRCQIVAVVHSEEVLSAGDFPVEDHDLRASHVVTENGIFAL